MSTRVSKETAVLLKDAGYDGAFKSIEIDENGDTLYLPTIHEASDWLRSKGVHVCVFISVDRKTGEPFWYFELVDLKTFKYIREGIGSLTYETFEAAYEAGIVNGLKYLK